ncbi:hypothetical protein ACTOB_003524 [Actinoplanes oblitus]|uniref:Uncharacterized protein n=1 Tax=Actinoplanes oblitus TaxID=3040509 RepID=A0ABY8WRY5_9ACTN|nr:hypothetical protein [Actinoplanes oblitus]WIM99858.1 hypothetical protein ACTOB_003524 [Actinoplanes oblitus]
MPSGHRPLSDWVATAVEDGGGLGPINDGADREDARRLARFHDGWQRAGFPAAGAPTLMLGLTRAAPPQAVIELDDTGRPILVSHRALTVIREIEEAWPPDRFTSRQHAVLSTESITVRHALVDRLDSEGTPDPDVYWLLPWADLLDEFVLQLVRALREGEPAPAIRLRHWFNPVGARFTAALEQLGEGVRRGDPVMTRLGAAGFLRRIQRVNAPRIPATTRTGLAELAGELARREEIHRFWGRRVAALLTEDQPGPLDRVRLSSEAPAVAATDRAGGASLETLRVPPFTVTLRLDEDYRTLTILVEADTELSEPVFLPVDLSRPGDNRRFHVPVTRRLAGFAGRLELREITGGHQVSVSEPALMLAEAAALTPAEVLPSLLPFRYMSDRPGRDAWARAAATLPPGSPLATTVATALGEMP